MKAFDILKVTMKGDMVLDVQEDPNNTDGLVVIFDSGYKLVCGAGWKWELNSTYEEYRKDLERRRRK